MTSPSGGDGLSHDRDGLALKDIVGSFARVYNKDVHYAETTDDEWRTEALGRGYNAHSVEHLSALWKSIRATNLSPEPARFAVTDTIEKVGGAKPKTFEQFVREQYQKELAAAPVMSASA